MALRCRVCGLVLEVRSMPPAYCPRCLATRRRAVELVAAPPRQPVVRGERTRNRRPRGPFPPGDGGDARPARPASGPEPGREAPNEHASAPESEPASPSASHLASASPPRLDRRHRLTAALALARDETAMDVAVLGEIRDGREIVRWLAGDAASFGLSVGASLPTKDTFCERLLHGRIPNIVRNARADHRVNDLKLARQARVGAYIGVPITARDARLFILCCLAHEQRPRLSEHDVLFMRGVAATIDTALHATSAADDDQQDVASSSTPGAGAPDPDGRGA